MRSILFFVALLAAASSLAVRVRIGDDSVELAPATRHRAAQRALGVVNTSTYVDCAGLQTASYDLVVDEAGAIFGCNGYGDSNSFTWYLHPGPVADNCVVTALSFETEACCDHVTLNNGETTTKDQGTLAADAQLYFGALPLNVTFASDGSNVGSGFQLQATCMRRVVAGTPLSLDYSSSTGGFARAIVELGPHEIMSQNVTMHVDSFSGIAAPSLYAQINRVPTQTDFVLESQASNNMASLSVPADDSSLSFRWGDQLMLGIYVPGTAGVFTLQTSYAPATSVPLLASGVTQTATVPTSAPLYGNVYTFQVCSSFGSGQVTFSLAREQSSYPQLRARRVQFPSTVAERNDVNLDTHSGDFVTASVNSPSGCQQWYVSVFPAGVSYDVQVSW